MHVVILFVSVYTFYESAAGIATQILVSPRNQTVPVDSVARFTCRTTGFVVWQIDSIQLSSQLISTSPIVKSFCRRGIKLDGENGSVLVVNATLKNNGIKILCLTGSELNVASNSTYLTVFGELHMN